MRELPETHKAALAWFRDHGGDGLIDQYGRVVAQGEKYKSADTASVWLRLVASGHIIGSGTGRLRFTSEGSDAASKLPPSRSDQNPSASHRGPLMVDDIAEDFA